VRLAARRLFIGEKILYGGDEQLRGRRFGHQGANAQQSGGGECFGGIVDGEEDDFDARVDTPDFIGCLHAIHHRHADIEQHDIGIEIAHLLESLPAVFRLAANPRDSLAEFAEHGASGAAGSRMIVDEQNPGGSVQSVSLRREAPDRRTAERWVSGQEALFRLG
jgi:hypothetical protein